jgi:hypothetical protein
MITSVKTREGERYISYSHPSVYKYELYILSQRIREAREDCKGYSKYSRHQSIPSGRQRGMIEGVVYSSQHSRQSDT